MVRPDIPAEAIAAASTVTERVDAQDVEEMLARALPCLIPGLALVGDDRGVAIIQTSLDGETITLARRGKDGTSVALFDALAAVIPDRSLEYVPA